MKTSIKPIPLSLADFSPFGVFANMLHPDSARLGMPPVEFYRDMVQQDLGLASIVSFSTCRIEQRDLRIDALECHSRTAEMMLPLDNDILIQLAPATPASVEPDLRQVKVFHVPRGTLFVMRPGVWHHGPFVTNHSPANILVALPERTYANDTVTFQIPDSLQPIIQIHT
ncbi:MAG: ureidoglycolate lyase [Opitutales bacterium]